MLTRCRCCDGFHFLTRVLVERVADPRRTLHAKVPHALRITHYAPRLKPHASHNALIFLPGQASQSGHADGARGAHDRKPVAQSTVDSAFLRRRSMVETVLGELKWLCQIEHARHRPAANFMVNFMSGIVACCLMPNKPNKPSLPVWRTALVQHQISTLIRN